MGNDQTADTVRNVQNRLNQLADRVHILESELKKTREMIGADIERIVTAMRKNNQPG